MKSKWITAAGVTAALLACSLSVQATPITGEVDFAGVVDLNNTIGLATGVSTWKGIGSIPNPQAATVSGSFASFVTLGDQVTIVHPWSFNSGAIASFWQLDGFTFDLTSSSVTLHNSSSVTVDGTGMISGNGFESTPGTWHFTTQGDQGTTFSFSSASSTVPDGGATMMLLGTALSALAVLRKKLIA